MSSKWFTIGLKLLYQLYWQLEVTEANSDTALTPFNTFQDSTKIALTPSIEAAKFAFLTFHLRHHIDFWNHTSHMHDYFVRGQDYEHWQKETWRKFHNVFAL